MKLIPDSQLYQKLEKWLEALLMTAGVLAMGYYFNRSDPFLVHGSFPWIWFAPLLIALRYGIAPGMVTVISICLTYLAMLKLGMLTGDFPTTYMLGGVLITLICGQFSTLWDQRLRRANQLSSHAGERFEQLSRAYFMVRLSHDRLEQNLISRPVTLRDAMMDLRMLLAIRGGELDKDTGTALISILVHYCSLESASLYPCDQGVPQDKPLASCGRGAPLHQGDLLLRSVLEKGTTAYQSVDRISTGERSTYLVAAPLYTSTGNMRAVLLISEMPFLSLHRETLQILGVLLAYAADHAEAAVTARSILTIYPDCPLMFACELIKMIRLRRDLDVSSSLVIVNISPTPRLEQLCLALERQQRGLDHTWRRNLGWGVQFVTLMPFSGMAAVEGYLARFDSMLLKQFGISAGSEGISTNSYQVGSNEPFEQLAELLTTDWS